MTNKNNLKKFRLSGCLTQQELASALCISRQSLINLERGIFYPNLLLAFKISKYFKTNIENIWMFKM